MGIGAVILAGGKSRRMDKENKALLQVNGKSFLEIIAGELAGFDEVLLSVESEAQYPDLNLPLRQVPDLYPDCGPMGGLVAALKATETEALLALSCDMPLFRRELGEYLCAYASSDYDAFVVMTRDGRVHPLCGVYRATALPVLEEQLMGGNLKMMDALGLLRVKYLPMIHSAYPDEMLANINTPDQYRRLLQKLEGPPVIAVSGVKNSGKTTLLCGILPILRQKGLRVGIVKHDAHDFDPDVPGTDSYRLRAAGGEVVGVYSPKRFLLTRETENADIETMTTFMGDCDLILLEGAKHSPYPKIEVVRGAVSSANICDPDTLLALCTDTDLAVPGVSAVGLDDITAVAEIILRHIHIGG